MNTKNTKLNKVSFLIITILSLLSFKSQAQKDTITIGAYVNSLYDFNLTDNSYKSEFWLWMKYNSRNNLDSIQNQLEFINAKSSPHIQAASTTNKNGISWYGAKYIGEFEKNWDVTQFPFDKQIVKITIESGEYSNQKIVFKCDYTNSKISKSFLSNLREWNLVKSKFYVNNANYNTTFGDPELSLKSSYPSFNFEFEISRRNSFLMLFKLITGLLVAFIISCCVFFIKPTNTDPRFGLSVGGLFAAIGNKYIIEGKVPATNQITLLDNIHNLTFVYILLITILSVISLRIYEKGTKKSKKLSKKIDRISVVTIMISYFLLLAYII
jgi:hypothetical protein